MPLSDTDRAALARAKRCLEQPSLAIKLSNYVGSPLEKGLQRLPASFASRIHSVTMQALERASTAAISTLDPEDAAPAQTFKHRMATALTGAGGGAMGLAGLAWELPTTTVIMLRSIADIARSEGHDIRALETRLACLEVFALGGPSRSDDAAETGYYAVRAALANVITDALQHVARHGFAQRGAPALVRLLAKIAERFSIAVSEKAATQIVPGIGAIAGATINTAFMDHFQTVAQGHFIVKRLEREHGAEVVREEYDRIRL